MRELIHKLCELGWFYRKISEYLKHHREELSFGVVRSTASSHSLALAIASSQSCVLPGSL